MATMIDGESYLGRVLVRPLAKSARRIGARGGQRFSRSDSAVAGFDDPGHQLLAGAAFAPQQDRRVGRGYLADQATYLLHGP